MLFKMNTRKKSNTHTPLTPATQNDNEVDLIEQSDAQQQLYARIARGNALADVEATAHRKWRS